uniref:Mitochondrial import inner membrane translocase subunit Tim21 n=1 Tax=Hirondellea gigas TaxID=1518452 RepID=A0A2P2I3E5_9CRUS
MLLLCQLKKKCALPTRHARDRANHAKEATKTTYYGLVVLAGLGMLGAMAYTLFGELFASFSPQSVYSDAAQLCINNTRVQDLIGSDSIKCYGEETRRGRRQHVSHLKYVLEGQRGMRIKFYLKGNRKTATAQLDAREGENGWYYRYLVVQVDTYPHQVVMIQDNRGSERDGEVSLAAGGDLNSFVSIADANPAPELTPLFPSHR